MISPNTTPIAQIGAAARGKGSARSIPHTLKESFGIYCQTSQRGSDICLLHRFLIHPRVMLLLMTAQAKLYMNTRALIHGGVAWLTALPAWSSYTIYVGKNLT